MQHLEMEAIGEEGKDCLSFLTACRVALWASPPKTVGSGDPLPPAPGKHAPLSTLLNIPLQYLPLDMHLPHSAPHPTAPMAPGPLALSKWQHPSPARLYPHLNQKPPQEWPLRSHPTQREGRKCLFTKY